MDELKARSTLRGWLFTAARGDGKRDEADLESFGLPPQAIAVMKRAAGICREYVQAGENGDALRHAEEIAGLVASRHAEDIEELPVEHPRDLARQILDH